ncbi:hypothetical protein BKA70DRAFT_1555224 [Coprinopsis sp. MPI-PUGE-AT-0042]|nr:hypothetical protein BKA70DRAFT_1555224 [Coprinopsis sp. MPI-PUGE-AT-0042]
MSLPVGVHIVNFWFPKRVAALSRSQKEKLVALSYAITRAQGIIPVDVFVRSTLHKTTFVRGRGHIIDPFGWHATVSYKDATQQYDHWTAHGYTNGQNDFILKHAIHTPAKPDNTPKGGLSMNQVVWPSKAHLVEWIPSPGGRGVAYCPPPSALSSSP